MKTLDEVIDCAEKWTENFDEGSLEKQMLFYLKMYRSDSRQWEANRKAYEDNRMQKLAECEAARDKYIARLKELEIGTLNDPLTWEELRTMEGKPVWVEGTRGNMWIIVGAFPKWMPDAFADSVPNIWWKKEDLGRDWQAYRKERNGAAG